MGHGRIPSPLGSRTTFRSGTSRSGVCSFKKRSDQGRTDCRYPGYLKLKIAVFYLENYPKLSDQGTIDKAKDMLKEHNIILDAWPDGGQMQKGVNNIPFKMNRLIEEEDYVPLRKEINARIQKAKLSLHETVPVLFGNFKEPGYGITKYDTPGPRPFILIRTTEINDDKVTLLHEMGHAADPPMNHDRTSTNPNKRNFMHEADTRTTMMCWQIERFAKSMFAVGD